MKRIFRSFLLIIFVALFASVLITETVNSEFLDQRISELSKPMVSGEIDPEIFSRSVPWKMTVGETYTIVLVVTNTGNVTADFLVYLYFPFRFSAKYFYGPSWAKNLTLSPGESQRTEFDITAVSDHVGPLILEGYLYLRLSNQTELVNSASATVYEIRTAFSTETMMWIIGFMVFLGFVAVAIRFGRKMDSRGEFIIAFMLFLVALSLRAPNLSGLAVYADEPTFEFAALEILHSGWKWPKEMMWGFYPPLMFYLQAALIYLFGSHLEVLRAVSVVCGSSTVVVVYFLGKSVFGKKVGLLSALLFCFSSFHILYSRIVMSESLVLFFIVMSSYLFWMGYKKKSWAYMCLSGIFLGLGINVKYISFVAVIASILFITWIGRSWRPLLKRDFLIWLATVLVVISPVQLTLLVNGVNPYWEYLSSMFGPRVFPEQVSHPFLEFIPRGLKTYIYWLGRAASPWLPWLPAYEFVIVVLLVISILYHVYPSLKARANESFIMLFFLLPLSFVAVMPVRHTYWLLYTIPYYFVMLANLIVNCVHSLRLSNIGSRHLVKGLKKHSRMAPLKILVLLLAGIFVFSNVVVGLMSPAIDTGEYEGARLAMMYVKNRVHEGEYIATWWGALIDYYVNLHDLNVTLLRLSKEPFISLARRERLIYHFEYELNEYVLSLKPHFIIIPRIYYDYYFNVTMKEEFLESYDISSWSPPLGYVWPEMTHQIWIVLERKTK